MFFRYVNLVELLAEEDSRPRIVEYMLSGAGQILARMDEPMFLFLVFAAKVDARSKA